MIGFMKMSPVALVVIWKRGTSRLECADSEMTTQASRERQPVHLPISVRVSQTICHRLRFFPLVACSSILDDLLQYKCLVAARHRYICSLLRQSLS